MNRIEILKNKIEKEVSLLDFCLEPKELFDPIRYILSLGGKRIRPVLTLMGAELFNGNVDAVLPHALAVEVFHNFTLLHDDIMDEAPLRRGMETVHKKWNTNIAILSGDAMMIAAYDLLIKAKTSKLPELMEVFNKTAMEVCIGQQYDMNFETQSDVAIQDYIKMIELKTSVLLGCALQLGAIEVGASKKDAELIYDFGKNIGIAFQLQDDILDVYADPDKFGKQVGGDIASNKKTYLMLTALERAEGENKRLLEEWISKTEFDIPEKVNAVTNIYNDLGIKEAAEEVKQHYFQKGMESLNAISVDESGKNDLRALAESLMVREV